METNEIDIQEQIGAELANNALKQYGLGFAIIFPIEQKPTFDLICKEIRSTW